MAYRFRFASVLSYRRNLEELAQQKLAAAQHQLARQQASLNEMEEELRRAIDAFEERKRRLISAPLYALFVEGIEYREREAAAQQRSVTAQRRVVDQARQELVARVRERKIMEKARERDYRKYLQEERPKEQSELDEQMVLRFGRHGGSA